ncbi:MAG TPA: response regulator [Vicinamibacteria bacterium]|nr:response regulator [Vicinamibacteria bacterium]
MEAAAAARFLLVTRDEDIQARLRPALAGAGYELESAADAVAAAARVAAERPRLVLVDLGLPRREGWTALVRLRALPDAPPVAVLIGRADYHAFAQAIREGAAACVFLPFVAGDLVALCEAVLTRAASAPVRDVRAHVRRLVAAEVSVLSAEGVTLAAGELANLGSGGAQVRLPVCLEAKTRVRLMLPVPVGDALIVDAVVQWNRRTASGFNHGLQFVDLTLARRRQLSDLLDSPDA